MTSLCVTRGSIVVAVCINNFVIISVIVKHWDGQGGVGLSFMVPGEGLVGNVTRLGLPEALG